MQPDLVHPGPRRRPTAWSDRERTRRLAELIRELDRRIGLPAWRGPATLGPMPTEPTARVTVMSVPDADPVAIVAVDLGADEETPAVRAQAIEVLVHEGLSLLTPDDLGAERVVPGWEAVIGAGRLLLTSSEGTRVYDGALPAPEGQEEALGASRVALVLAGHLGDITEADPMEAATAAALRGECATGVVAARPAAAG